MRVVLGTFARRGIEALTGHDLVTGVEAALRHHVSGGELDMDRRGLARLSADSDHRSGTELELSVDPQVEAVLRREANGMPVDQVVVHAVLAYLADLDRAAEHMVRPLAHV